MKFSSDEMKFVFGPVPSRRLGLSLGINNIPPKYCTYSCVYCQIGRTSNLTIKRRAFFNPHEISKEVVEFLGKYKGKVDYVTIVPDGEPTLDVNIGKLIELLKKNVNLPVAVLSNASLLFIDNVRCDLAEADLVSMKIDAGLEDVFRKINRPYSRLNLYSILEGMKDFSQEFDGILLTETMLVKGVNDSEENLRNIASKLKEINPSKAYIAIPVRPPAERWVKPPPESKILLAYKIFEETLGEKKVSLLVEKEPGFTVTGLDQLISITMVHPIRIDEAIKMLEKAGLDPYTTLNKLIDEGVLVKIHYHGEYYILRKTVQQQRKYGIR